MLRRTQDQVKAQLALPPCVQEDRLVDMTAFQRGMYDSLAAMLTGQVAMLSLQQQSPDAVNQALRTFMSVRQVCCHPRLVASIPERDRRSAREAIGSVVLQV